MEIKLVGVLGLGTMGAGIAQVFAQGGQKVVALEVNQEFIDKGMDRINKLTAEYFDILKVWEYKDKISVIFKKK